MFGCAETDSRKIWLADNALKAQLIPVVSSLSVLPYGRFAQADYPGGSCDWVNALVKHNIVESPKKGFLMLLVQMTVKHYP
jgi:hypothetical protein